MVQSEHQIAIVIPTTFRERFRSVRQRLDELVSSGVFTGRQLIVSHGSLEGQADHRFRAWLEDRHENGVLDFAWSKLDSSGVPIGLLRNRGAKLATADWILFIDVDLAVPEDFFAQIERSLERPSSSEFRIVPCLYATRRGTRNLSSGCVFDTQAAEEAFYGHRRDLIAHVALNTSTVLVKRPTFWDLGGFDERYRGHGLEDFDLLIRLAIDSTDLPIPTDILRDTPTHAPAFSVGFRSFLNVLSLPNFLDGLCTLHRWHERPLHRAYYHAREQNQRLLGENVAKAIRSMKHRAPGAEFRHLLRPDGTYDSLASVSALCREHLARHGDVSALFDNCPQHLFDSHATWRRFRKVVRRFFGADPSAPPPTPSRLRSRGGTATNTVRLGG